MSMILPKSLTLGIIYNVIGLVKWQFKEKKALINFLN